MTSADESRPAIRRARGVERAALPEGPAKALRDLVFRLYAEADRPRLEDLAAAIAANDDLPGAPRKDLINAVIGGGTLATQNDTIAVAMALALAAGREDVAQVARRVRELWIEACTAPPPEPAVPAAPAERLGRPVSECDPLALEVHTAIQVAGAPNDPLPAYVPRVHDEHLRRAADRVVADGGSRLITLVGGSSSGKTRACWELALYLEERDPGRWRLWHPYDPTRPEAAMEALKRVGPYTIVWLNEAQHYLAPPDTGLGERIAAGLRSLLQDRACGPVLVLATLWREYWNDLIAQPVPGSIDRHPQVRELLAATRVDVDGTFSSAELARLLEPGTDPRVRQAAERAEGGRVTQYLAGAPEIENRYRTAPPVARAILDAAIDARRLGHPPALPRALLERAAPGYLDDHDWDNAGEDWLGQALAYTGTNCKGARGPLTRIHPRPTDGAGDGEPSYRLADHLEQTGGRERAGTYPPDSLWHAFATAITDPGLQRALGDQANGRGRYQHAIWLYTSAADRDDTDALVRLARLREGVGDPRGAEVFYRKAAELGDTDALVSLALLREQAGDAGGAEAFYRKAAELGDTVALVRLVLLREEAGDLGGAEVAAVQAAEYGNANALFSLARSREMAGDREGAEALAVLAAEYGEAGALFHLARLREAAGDFEGAEAAYHKAAEYGDAGALFHLARLREAAGDLDGAEAFYRRLVERGDTFALHFLARLREQADTDGAEALAVQLAEHGDSLFTRLARVFGQPEHPGDAGGVYQQAVEYSDTTELIELAQLRERAGDLDDAEALYRKGVEHGDTFALQYLASLQEATGNADAAERLRTFGLTGSGEIAAGLVFGPYPAGASDTHPG